MTIKKNRETEITRAEENDHVTASVVENQPRKASGLIAMQQQNQAPGFIVE